MATTVSLLLLLGAALVAVPVDIFLVEVIAGLLSLRRKGKTAIQAISMPRQRIAVLVPAHNESTGIKPTLADIKDQLRPGDRILVVADNCTDDTAGVAKASGAEVIERHDPIRRGKGYALDFGLRHLSSDPPAIVIMVDADCRLANNTIDELVTTCLATRRPVQALYLMTAPTDFQINQQVAEFAWRVKNWLRPLGLKAFNLPCQLMGTGMAFPWQVIRDVDLSGGFIVEDLKLGLELAANGHPPIFCPNALVTSQFAPTEVASKTQRQRWEGGHMAMIFSSFPRLFIKALGQRNWNLLALTMDLAVPPLSFLALAATGMFAVTLIAAIFGVAFSALVVSTTTALAFLLATFLAWRQCRRDIQPIGSVLSIPRYILSKLGLYSAILRNKTDAEWIRTGRTKSE